MYRDTIILLVLKEIFQDPYLVNIIFNIIHNDEIYSESIFHKIKTNCLREDIQMLYPGFIKTALFENIRFDIHDDLEPGYSFYSVKPLTDCGYLLDYNMNPPFKYSICEYSDYKKNYNTVNLLNHMRQKYSLSGFGKDKIKLILKKRKRYANNELNNFPKSSIWYDFENNIFTSV